MWKKNLDDDGFPYKDLLNSIIAPLIAEFQPDARSRVYPPEAVVFMMVGSVLSKNSSLNAAVVKNNMHRFQQGLDPASVNTSAYSDARSRLDSKILLQAFKQMAIGANEQIEPSKFWEGLKPKLIDGSTITTNDSPENQEVFPQHGMQKDGIGFPILRIEILQSLESGMIQSAAFGPYKGKETGEMALARKIFPDLEKGSLLIGDRYFPSYFTMAELINNGSHGLFQSHAARDVDFRQGKQLGKKDHLVEWDKPSRPSWMSPEEYKKYPDSLTIREVDISGEIDIGERFIVVTTLLDSVIFTKSKLSKFYKQRWKIESALKDLKDTFNMHHISANSPEIVEKVFWSYMLSYNVLRWHILNAAYLYKTTIDKISVKNASNVITANSGLILSSKKEEFPKLFANLYCQFVQVPVGMRPGRSEPRAVKKRPKPFPRLQEKRSDWHERRTS
jgi:hypothetical protein